MDFSQYSPGVTLVTIEDGLIRIDSLDLVPHPLDGCMEIIITPFVV